MRKLLGLLAFGLIVLGSPGCTTTTTTGHAYSTPRDAMTAFAAVAGQGDNEALETIFGADAGDVLSSGDPAADRADGELIKAMILERMTFTEDGDTTEAVIGADAWVFPVPIVRTADGWCFDLEAGAEEVANRRVGRNELMAIASLHEYVDAQREYASESRDGQPPAFASRFRSSPGMHDGLFWPVEAGDVESPLGPLLADAVAELEAEGAVDDGPYPFHGYYFRILTAQGPHAPGGARSYVDENGRMTGGYAAVAWPARWDHAGVMTFIVSHVGIVFEKNLGEDTEAAVVEITAFDPDETWEPTQD